MDRQRLLGDFLRARRESTRLEDVGLTRVGRRRTPGLRREEVAMLAGVSTDYYVRLEQGRERRPSEQVLDALARVLELDPAATEHLYELAHPRPRQRPARREEEVAPGLLRLLRLWDHTPAFIRGRWMDLLATNGMADALYGGLDHNDNLLRLCFLNPEARAFYPDWEQSAALKAAQLRTGAGTDPDDPFLPQLVDELSDQSAEFVRIWARHDVLPRHTERKRFRHPIVGELMLSYEVFTINSAPGQQLVIFQADPGSPSERGLAMLSSLVRPPQEPVLVPQAGAAPGVHRQI
ncbi:helix-turn-helix transcriptional regulator [Microbispora sp. ATCC PTA-5024]|uniref:helix-turn-helix transcriptional regulator n=1 Tax=Microbispora sp. ATCC PTA-5024 TaxID=316330 RepID=UPI000A023BF2|nr:helix-turn-helix transcriptional regulator [Microbispora sp. ATCC PTA-5024]